MIKQFWNEMKDDLFVYTGPDLNLIRKPSTLHSGSPRRHLFSYPMRLLRDKFALHYLGTHRTMDQPSYMDLEQWAIDEAYRLMDLSQVYQIEIWYDRRTQRLFLQFLLAD